MHMRTSLCPSVNAEPAPHPAPNATAADRAAGPPACAPPCHVSLKAGAEAHRCCSKHSAMDRLLHGTKMLRPDET